MLYKVNFTDFMGTHTHTGTYTQVTHVDRKSYCEVKMAEKQEGLKI